MNKEFIEEVLSKLPEVVWDRFATSDNATCIFGWIKREDGKFDFVQFVFFSDNSLSFSTSSAEYSKDFSERLGLEGHSICQRVEHHFENINSIKLHEVRRK